MPDPAKTYDGRPCRNCQDTLKWRSNNSCVACNKARSLADSHRRYWAEGTEGFIYRAEMTLRRRRSDALRRMAERNQGRT